MRSILSALCGLALAGTAATVTPVSGPSVLRRLGIDYRDTSLGRGAGRYGPNPGDPAVEHKPVTVKLDAPVKATGADLYRWNCQACHRAEGTGAPPEIKSMLPVVQGSSLQMMAKTVTSADQARADLYTRVEKGGQKMPAREHLGTVDVDVLYAYLTTLAGGRAAKAAAPETISVDRLGENVVKGTCHICHDAAGPRPSPKAMMDGAIPSLASIIAQKPIADFVFKVRSGAPTIMGEPAIPHRGRMPVFYYLTEQEIAAAYKYLGSYPPVK